MRLQAKRYRKKARQTKNGIIPLIYRTYMKAALDKVLEQQTVANAIRLIVDPSGGPR